MKFSIGDIVERINSSSKSMEIGERGTVFNIIDDTLIELSEHPGEQYAISNFKLVEESEIKKEEEINIINENLNKIMKKKINEELESKKERLKRVKNDIVRYSEYIKNLYKDEKIYMAEIDGYEKVKEKDYTSDIKALFENKYVKNIKPRGANSIEILTDYIDIYDELGNRFRGNKYNLLFTFSEMTCYIEGLDDAYCRKSYWTDSDPHPHVDGETGEACWGSAGSMLTQAMNEYELYTSFIIVLNFLQQVNTSDVAGKNIRHWDCIDDDDNDLENPYEDTFKVCSVCERELDEGESLTCEDCGSVICENCFYSVDDRFICDNCYESDYTTCDECDTIISNSDSNHYNNYVYCDDCYDEKFSNCDNCGDRFEKEDMIWHNDDIYCDECYDEKITTCDECNENVERCYTFYCNSCKQTFCEICKDEPIPGMCQDCYEEEEEEEGDEE